MASVYDLEEAFKKIEDDLVNEVINGIKKTTPESVLKKDNIAVWRSKQLRALQDFKKRNKKYFTKEREKELYDEISRVFSETYKKAGSAQQKQIINAIKNGFNAKPVGTDEEIAASFNGVNDRKLNALITETQKNLYKAETSAVRYAEDQYRQIIFNSNVYFNTGSGNLVKCIDMATRDFLAAGINNIEYKNGRRVNIQSYAEMALRTAEKRSYIQGEAKMRDNYGLGLVIVNRRGNACPKCMQYVGKIFNDDVYGSQKPDRHYPLLSTAIAGGLYHPNCKDVHTTYFPNITTEYPAPTKNELEKAERQYVLEQQQRYNERQIRKYKRLADGTLEETEQEKYAEKVKQWQAKQRELIKENPELVRKYWRESVVTSVEPSDKIIRTSGEINKPVKNFKFEKLEKTMPAEDFVEFKKMIDENETVYKIFNDYNDQLDSVILTDDGRYVDKYKKLEFDYVEKEYIKGGMNKYGTLAHEYGHFIDHRAKDLAEKSNLKFKDWETIKKHCYNDAKQGKGTQAQQLFDIWFDYHTSSSNEYLEAIEKDNKILQKLLFEDNDKDFKKMLIFDDYSSSIQDYISGRYGKEVTTMWGHKEKYYNRIYNSFAEYKKEKLLKDAFLELGYDASNQTKVKQLTRKFDTANELWANQISALTVGGKELEVMEKYMPNSLSVLKKIIE